MLGLVSLGVATTGLVAGTGFGLGLAGLAAIACRYRNRRQRDDLERL